VLDSGRRTSGRGGLGVLEPSRVAIVDGSLVERLAAEAWKEATADEADSREVTHAALSLLESFVASGAHVESSGLAVAVSDSGGVSPDEASVSTRDELYGLAEEFVDAGLLETDDLSDRILDVMTSLALGALLPGSSPPQLQDARLPVGHLGRSARPSGACSSLS